MPRSDPYEWLRAAIAEGRMQPNERLVEADLVRATGAGRSAVRVALVRLAQDGLVEHSRNRGARVRMVGEEEAVELLEARAAIEGLAARGAAQRATGEDVGELRAILAAMQERLNAGDRLGAAEREMALRERVLALSGSATAMRLARTLDAQLVRFRYHTLLVPGRPERESEAHAAIVDAIASGDAAAAEAAMRGHLLRVGDALRAARAVASPARA